jgi:hypothetical protein
MSNVLLGNVAAQVQTSPIVSSGTSANYDAVSSPINLPSTTSKVSYLPVEGGILYDLPLERLEDPGVPPPTEDKNDTGTGNKKNLLLFGIGGLVLAYLLFRKK